MGLVRFSIAHRRLVLGVAALITLALAPFALTLKSDNRAAVYYPRAEDSVGAFRATRATFGASSDLRFVLRGDALLTAEGLLWQRALELEGTAVAGVSEVAGLPAHLEPTLGQWPPRDMPKFRKSLDHADGARQRGLISTDQRTVTLLVTLEDLTPEEELSTLQALELLCLDAPDGTRATLAGLPVLARALDESSAEILFRFLPFLLLSAFALIVIACGEPRMVGATGAFVGGLEVVLLGAMGLAGLRLNLVLSVLPPVMFVVALATAVHLLMGARAARRSGKAPVASVLQSFEERSWAVLATGITTGIGFASLVTADLPPVRMLGLCATLGVAVLTLAAFVVLPALLVPAVLNVGKGSLELRADSRGRALASFAARHRTRIMVAAALLIGACLIAVPRLEVESNALTYLPPDHPVRLIHEDLGRQGIGVASLELVLSLSGRGDTPESQLDTLSELSALTRTLSASASVLGVVSAGSVVDDAALRLAEGDRLEAPEWRPDVWDEVRHDATLREQFDRLITRDGQKARLVILTRLGGLTSLDSLKQEVQSSAREVFPAAEVCITGTYSLLLEAQRRLLTTLALSFGLSLLGITLVMALHLRRGRLVAIALVANVLPALIALGAMGWLGIPVDIATVMVASVVLGLAVDDTLHTLGHFIPLSESHEQGNALGVTLSRVVSAHTLTAAILVLGFGACALSSFAPTARFGGLAALAVFAALIGDLVLLPALLVRPGREGEGASAD